MSVNNVKFLNELKSLRKLINYYITEIKLVTSQIPVGDFGGEGLVKDIVLQLKAFNVDKRTFNYNSLIISLYGFFEKFIEDIIENYVDDLNIHISEYNRLPESIIKHHLNLSMQMIGKIDSIKYQGALTIENVIANLYSCINDRNNYRLNKEAFKQHAANFRYQTINEVFNRLGVFNINESLLSDNTLKSHLIAKLGKNKDDKITVEDAYYHIDDLAERRNDVAHGVVGQILNPELLNDYVEFFEIYSSSLCTLVNKNLAALKVLNNSISLGELTGWYKNGNIVCFNTHNNKITVGTVIWGLNEHGYVESKILSIKLNEIAVTTVDDNFNYDIGVELDVPFKKTHRVFLIKAEAPIERKNVSVPNSEERHNDLNIGRNRFRHIHCYPFGLKITSLKGLGSKFHELKRKRPLYSSQLCFGKKQETKRKYVPYYVKIIESAFV